MWVFLDPFPFPANERRRLEAQPRLRQSNSKLPMLHAWLGYLLHTAAWIMWPSRMTAGRSTGGLPTGVTVTDQSIHSRQRKANTCLRADSGVFVV